MDELGPGMSGRWVVHTRGSTHVWDMDARTYARHPRTPAAAMPHDGVDHPIRSVGAWPRVGAHSYVVFDDPQHSALEHWRQSGTILSIVPAVD
ncbi:hypothetical protein FB474_1453 [Oryzihumus leptocrescens]|uniref:Uncharacterized protein n=1 Tax=Oryzihumus leptocrescens TaxID=297536 RepID=A0A542ZIC7_9MICO|nr:hypothetical protein FB474_1453 [Oryzihumus leptocrescens]